MASKVSIVTQPKNITAIEGETFTVKVVAKGDGLTYKWYYKDKGAAKFTYTATFKGNTYTTQMTKARDGRQIYCVITDKYGNSVQSNTVTLSMVSKVATVTQPKSITAIEGEMFTVKVVASTDLRSAWLL